jgi:hypothetical protein
VRAAGEIHPHVEEVTDELGIDSTVGFNYSVVVCARAEKYCPEETFPGVGTRLIWAPEDPKGEKVSEEERLEKFREIRDEIELKINDWLEHPEGKLGVVSRTQPWPECAAIPSRPEGTGKGG